MAFSPDGTRIATGTGSDGGARVLDAPPARRSPAWTDRRGDAVAFSPDGTRIATASAMAARGLRGGYRREIARVNHDGRVNAVAFSPDGARVATGSSDGGARVFDAATGAQIARLDHRRGVTRWRSARTGPGSPPAATAARGCWRRPPARRSPAWTGHRLGHCGGVQPGRDPDRYRRATTAGVGGATGAPSEPRRRQEGVYPVAFNPEGRRSSPASDDSTARVCEAADRHELARLDHTAMTSARRSARTGR